MSAHRSALHLSLLLLTALSSTTFAQSSVCALGRRPLLRAIRMRGGSAVVAGRGTGKSQLSAVRPARAPHCRKNCRSGVAPPEQVDNLGRRRAP